MTIVKKSFFALICVGLLPPILLIFAATFVIHPKLDLLREQNLSLAMMPLLESFTETYPDTQDELYARFHELGIESLGFYSANMDEVFPERPLTGSISEIVPKPEMESIRDHARDIYRSTDLGGYKTLDTKNSRIHFVFHLKENLIAISEISKFNLYHLTYMSMRILLVTILGELLVIMIAGFIMSKGFAARMQNLTMAIQNIGKEKFAVKMSDSNNDEIGQLSRVMNDAAEQLLNNRYKQQAAEQVIITTNEALYNSQQRYELAVLGANDAIWDWDLVNNKLYLSSRWWEMLDLTVPDKQTVSPERWTSRIHIGDKEAFDQTLNDHLYGQTPYFEAEYRVEKENGDICWILTRGLAIEDESGRKVRMAGSHTDISNRKEMQDRISFMAYYDPLTELPNRTLLLERIKQATYRAQRQSNYGFSIFFLDLDGFKHVNDTYGHAIGDMLLRSISARLLECVRPLDVVARLGGDEFILMLDGITTREQAIPIADRVNEDIRKEFTLSNHSIFISVSIGILIELDGDTPPEDLLQNADIAMYYSKVTGKGKYTFFSKNLRHQEQSRWSIEHELHKALGGNDLMVWYQPIKRLQEEGLYGFEALIRWNHSKRGFISPAEFLPTAEESGFITRITEWILNQVCIQAIFFNRKLDSPFHPLIVSFNITAKDFLIPGGLDNLILRTTEVTGCDPSWLAIEVTESDLIRNFEVANAQLKRLKEHGFLIELDDFGTGYSSLAYIHRFPLDCLKIDQSFIRSLPESSSSRKITKSIIDLCHNLDLKVIAEGVEEEEHMTMLSKWGCEYMQGYHLSKPLAPNDAVDFLIKKMNYTLLEEDLPLL